ncbi:MAG: formimidoylglutamase, partial [Hymenobacteraceae bacterium]|nr:formimidoylglutamase [Hymenobacteraceae bacterium]
MYKPSTKAAWLGRTDAQDGTLGFRWHQAMQFLNLSESIPAAKPNEAAFAFLGFCCDEGVSRNMGRVG